MTTCIIGLGSSHGDDRLAWCVLEQLERNLGAGNGVRYIYSDRTVFDWIGQFEGASRLLFVDAVSSDSPPGTIHRIDLGNMPPGRVKWLSSHGFSLMDALDMAKKLYKLPAQTILYGIEMQQCQPLAEMETAVMNAVPECVKILEQAIRF